MWAIKKECCAARVWQNSLERCCGSTSQSVPYLTTCEVTLLFIVLFLSATSPCRNHVLPSPEPQFYLLIRGFNWEVEFNMKVAQPLSEHKGTPISDASILKWVGFPLEVNIYEDA